MKKIKFVVVTFLMLITLPSYSIMMTSTRIAYVDIARVFEEIREVREARDKLKTFIEEKKQKIEETERAIASVRNKIFKDNLIVDGNRQLTQKKEVSENDTEKKASDNEDRTQGEDSLNDEEQENSSEPEENIVPEDIKEEQQPVKARMPAFEIEEFNQILAQKEKELRVLMEESKKLVQGKEKEFNYKILGKIYEMVKNIAKNKGYNVIVDKEMILFSEEAVVDITDDVIRSLNEKCE